MKIRRLIPGGAVVASLALITAGGVVPTVAQASAARGGAGPVVMHYTGTTGVARLLPRNCGTRMQAPTRAFPKGARRLPSGRFSATEAVPRTSTTAGAAAATIAPRVNFNGVSSRDSQFTNYNAEVRTA